MPSTKNMDITYDGGSGTATLWTAPWSQMQVELLAICMLNEAFKLALMVPGLCIV
jgi:hypothetical protein